ncbi:MAG: 4Fe-4S binding protein [Deltaproteobacteria bacterium]
MARIEIDEQRCKGCGLCTIICPKQLIILCSKVNNLGYTVAVFDPSAINCTGCTLCAEICPDVAIKVFK